VGRIGGGVSAVTLQKTPLTIACLSLGAFNYLINKWFVLDWGGISEMVIGSAKDGAIVRTTRTAIAHTILKVVNMLPLIVCIYPSYEWLFQNSDGECYLILKDFPWLRPRPTEVPAV
jgi:hypothetical protein